MPVVLTPATPFVVTEEKIRMFLRDYALEVLPGGQGNIILDDVQFTIAELDNAIEMAVSAFNGMTPISSYTRETFPNEYLLLIGAARFLMMSESFHQLRNQISAQDGDVTPSGIYEKANAYVALAQTLKQEWQEIARPMKNQLNMEGAYGYVGSGYSYIGRRGRYL
jgi:hypothetical protein